MLGGIERSQMYFLLWEQVASFHIPERFGFPTTGSASIKRHFPSPYQCSSPSQESQGRKETKSPLAGPLPSPCLRTPSEATSFAACQNPSLVTTNLLAYNVRQKFSLSES